MTSLPKAVAAKMAERAEALGLKGKRRDDAALDFYCGAIAALDLTGQKAEADWLGRVAVMLISTRGFTEVARMAADAKVEAEAEADNPRASDPGAERIEAEWNTGRAYSEQGQIIRARVEADGSIVFADLSRGVNGRVAASPYPVADAASLRRRVMVAYDANAYRADAGSWEYAHIRKPIGAAR